MTSDLRRRARTIITRLSRVNGNAGHPMMDRRAVSRSTAREALAASGDDCEQERLVRVSGTSRRWCARLPDHRSDRRILDAALADSPKEQT